MLILFVPIVFGAHSLYKWTHQEELAHNAVLLEKSKYLNLSFFTVRAAIYFAIWLALAYFLNRWSLLQDRTADRELKKRMGMLSGPGMVLFVFTVTFASVDWFMSLDPEWYSTIYGLIFVAAWALSGLAFTSRDGAVGKQRRLASLSSYHFPLSQTLPRWCCFVVFPSRSFGSSVGKLPEKYAGSPRGTLLGASLDCLVPLFAFPFLFCCRVLSNETQASWRLSQY